MSPADIIAVKGNSGLATDLVLSVTGGEISHVALVLCVADEQNPNTLIIESVSPRTRVVPLDECLKDHELVYLLKALTLTRYDRETIIREALKWSTRDYSYLACALVGIGRLVDNRWMLQHLRAPNENMCSWLVAEGFKAAGRDFGAPYAATEPSDIFHFAVTTPKHYQVLKLRG